MRRFTLLAFTACLCAAAGCSLLTDLGALSSGSGAPDGGSAVAADASADARTLGDGAPPPTEAGPGPARCDPTKPFDPPVPLTTLNLPGENERAARLTLDELTIYFASDRTNVSRIYRATRATVDAPFGAPALLDELTTSGVDFLTATPSADGLELIVEQRLSDGGGPRGDLRRLTRAAPTGPFGNATDVGSVNTTANETDPGFGGGDLELWFARSSATGPDIFVAKRTSLTSPFGADSPPPGDLNTPAFSESDPVPSADGTELFFQTDREGPARIWVARRTSPAAPLGAPVHVTELDGPGTNDVPNWLSRDRCVLYLTSFRENGIADLYVATRPR